MISKDLQKKLDKLKIGDVVRLEFDDHCTDMPMWAKKEDWHHTICTVMAVGFVAAVGKRYLTITQLMQTGLTTASQSFTVVISCINCLRVLK